jgi:hypothetical protein
LSFVTHLKWLIGAEIWLKKLQLKLQNASVGTRSSYPDHSVTTTTTTKPFIPKQVGVG